MIKYLGSKRLLIPALLQIFRTAHPQGSVIDLFSGTSRVGHALKRGGYRVLANDHNAYAATLARCYVQADLEEHLAAATKLVAEFNRMSGSAGYFTDMFCERSWFFQPKNGARVDAIREEIERKGLPPELKAILLVSLMEAADRVDSTTGVQMAYLKQWAARANNDLELRVPDILPRAASGKGEAHHLDAEVALDTLEADVCYLDPPYNQHKYLGNYHIWESLVLWDKPETYGVACKRVDCRDRGSQFNSKPASRAALHNVIRRIRTKHLVVSFNNEGYFTRADIEAMLAERGDVVVIEHDYKRYVGAQIGIHNPQGQRVGEVSHLRNTEYVYVASDDPAFIARVRALGAVPSANAQAPLLSAAGAGESEKLPPMPLAEVRLALAAEIQRRGSLSNAEAQSALGVDGSTIRVAFKALVAAGLASPAGAGRATRYLSLPGGTPAGTPAAAELGAALVGGVDGPVEDIRASLVEFLAARRDASSQDAQRALSVPAPDLRVVLQAMIADGQVETSGQRRGTRYRWVGERAVHDERHTVESARAESIAPGRPLTLDPAPRARPSGQQALFAALD